MQITESVVSDAGLMATHMEEQKCICSLSPVCVQDVDCQTVMAQWCIMGS